MQLLRTAALAVLALGIAGAAHATPTVELMLSEPGYAARVVDGSGGIAQFAGSYGSFALTSDVGLGAPLLTPATLIDLTSATVTSAASRSLTIELTETGLQHQPGPVEFSSSIGGGILNAGLTLSYTSYADATDTAFGLGTELYTHTFTGQNTAYAAADETAAVMPGLFSETIVLSLNAAADNVAGRLASIDASLSDPVPEPASMALLGTGLIGLGLTLSLRRRG